MVKAAIDVSPIVDAYVDMLKRDFDVERVILCDIHTDGVDGEPTEIQFIVVSSRFESMEWDERSVKLGMAGIEVSPLIVAFAYTPGMFAGQFSGKSYDGVLAQFLGGSREVYLRPGSTPLEKLRKTARRKS
jgi:hypothetical protein